MKEYRLKNKDKQDEYNRYYNKEKKYSQYNLGFLVGVFG